jgi:hypothetical protein
VRRALVILAVAGAGALAVRACAGPRPSVESSWLEPRPGGYVAAATVRNGGGEGEIQVSFRLRDLDSGRTVQFSETAQVRRGEEVEVRAFVQAPPGRWTLEAESEYPPR